MTRTRSALAETVARTLLLVAATSLGACNAIDRLSEVGNGPEVSNIQNPTQKNGYKAVSMPMPTPQAPPQNANSLWRAGSRAFFKDQRAKDVGDILSVSLTINDSATFSTALNRSRNNSETANTTALMGFENSLTKILPATVNPADLLNVGSTSSSVNGAYTGRTEVLTANIAATISQILPNGNLVIAGTQEIKVNQELREVTVQGIVRPEDISTSNTVTYDKIAEARIYYGGRGVASDFAQPRYGQEILDVIFPF